MSSRHVGRFAAVLVTAALVVTSCGSGGDAETEGAGGGSSTGSGSSKTAKPVKGGTINFGTYAETSGLDPTVSGGSGVSGGIELAAIYDTLMRFDPDEGTYVPQLAAGLEPNDDSSVWTLKLRDGVTFTDGTPLDAEAVVFSLKRHIEKKSRFADLVSRIKSYETPDDRTVVLTLTEPWTGFPFVLAFMPGMVVSPTAVEKLGDEAFNTEPVGAGAFKLDRFAPGEELVLSRNDDYFDGPANLEGLRFTNLGGAQASFESLESGGLQMAFLRDPVVVDKAKQAKVPGFLALQNAGGVVLINQRTDGAERIGTDLRIRQAIAMALDPEVLDQRADQGQGTPTFDLFPDSSPWHGRASKLEHDPEAAKDLVQEVKDETGWDGKIDFACSNVPSRKNFALAAGASLDAVGFDTDVQVDGTVSDLIRQVQVDHDYDLACWGFNVGDDNPFVGLNQHLASSSGQNASGYADDEFDALIDELQVSPDDETTKQVLDRIQARWDETIPSVTVSAVPEYVAWDPKVHGVEPTVKTMVLLDDAFLAES